jgi:XTP/dITP diphosphohydrolase
MKTKPTAKILIGTTNQGKIRELNELLADLPAHLIDLDEVGQIGEIEETGATFAENASLKAIGYARQTGLMTIGDDSGLEVAALANAPGVFSARYGGNKTGFDEKIRLLLNELNTVPNANRSARFVCVMSLANAEGEVVFEAEGVCSGQLAESPRGTGGFGYDPIFIPSGFDMTFGELGSDIKQQISHRARAAVKIIRYLQGFFAV